MRPLAAAVLFALISLAALPAAALADGDCTPIENRIRVGPRAAGDIITQVSTDVPKATVDGSTVSSKITVAEQGIVRTVKVKNIAMAHTNLADLTLRLRTPDGTLVLLADALAGANLAGTTFSDAAPSIHVGLPPYLGTFAPQEWLAQLYGEQIAGDWQLEISDAAGSVTGTLNGWAIEIAPESCEEQPVASFTATPNPAVPGATVYFDAAASTGGNNTEIVHYEWDLDGDGTFETDTGQTPTTTHVYTVKGTYPAAVRVTDSTGASDERVQGISITERPVASMTITPSSPFSLVNTSFDATASTDSDGTIVRYEWDLDGDGTFEVDAGNIATITRLFGTAGSRDVALKVTDDSGATDVALQTVVVQNRAPTAAFASQQVPAVVGATTTLDASTSNDLDGTIVNHEWDLDDDGTYETTSGGAPTQPHVFTASGTYTIGLRVTDNLGASAESTGEVTATQAPVAVVGASPLLTRPGTPVTFDPAGSADPDPLGSIAQYSWDFDGDGSDDLTTTSGAPVSHAYSAFGEFTARLTVTDDLGATGSATVVVDVHNDPPTAALSISPTAALTGQPVTLSAAGSVDADGPIAKYEWDLDGNGTFETNSGTTATLVRSFPNRMRAMIGVRVTDGDGATDADSGSLSVDPPPAPPGVPGGGGSGDGPGGGPGGADGAGDVKAFTASLSGASIQKLRLVLRRGVGVSCTVDRSATCVLEIVVSARDARKLRLTRGKRSVRIARARKSAAASGTHRLTLKLTPRAKRALKRSKRRIVVVVRGTATDASGAKAALKRAVLLRR